MMRGRPGCGLGRAVRAVLICAGLAAACAPAAPALAQDGARVLVQSGEHGAFTRLAMVLPEAPVWRLGRLGEGYGLRIEASSALSFDISDVWTRIDRSRIARLTTAPDGLEISLGCACHAVGFVDGTRVLVIDVMPGPAPAGSAIETPLNPPGAADPAASMPAAASERPVAAPAARLQARTLADGRLITHGAGDGMLRSAASGELPLMLPQERFRDVLGEIGALPHRDDRTDAGREAATAPPQARALDPRILEAQEDLLRGLGEAAARGAIEIDRPLPRFEREAVAPAAASPTPALPGAPADGGQIVVHEDGAPQGPGQAAGGAACLADGEIDLAAWGTRETVFEDAAALRRRLIGEFDRPDTEAILALVRLNLFAGFGAEARNLIEAFAPVAYIPAEAHELARLGPSYAEVARILDGKRTTDGGALSGMEVCDSHAALWGALALPGLRRGDRINVPAVLRGFSALPAHLRNHLGPDLAQRLIEHGSTDAAITLREMLDRAPEAGAGELGLIGARIDLATGRGATAEAGLGDLITSNEQLSVAAMADLVDSVVARGAALDPAMLLTLEALARENQGGTEAGTLGRALALGRAAAGDADGAFAAAADLAVAGEVWSVLAARADGAALLARALDPKMRVAHAKLAPEVRLAVARRLLEFGFSADARAWVGEEASDGARLVRAEARLREGAPADALAELGVLATPEALKLRAVALRRAGDAAAAASVLTASGDAAAAQAALLQAGNWAAAANGPDAELGALVATLIAPPPPLPDTPPPRQVGTLPPDGLLAAGREILASATRQREAVSTLIARTAPHQD
jgi:hypothetical protein